MANTADNVPNSETLDAFTEANNLSERDAYELEDALRELKK